MRDDEIIKSILEYVKDERYQQAVLIDGEWGRKNFFCQKKIIAYKASKEKMVQDSCPWHRMIRLRG